MLCTLILKLTRWTTSNQRWIFQLCRLQFEFYNVDQREATLWIKSDVKSWKIYTELGEIKYF